MIALILLGVFPLGGMKQGKGGESSYFLDLCVSISKTVADMICQKLLLITNRKLHIRFWLIPISMTLDDLELQ